MTFQTSAWAIDGALLNSSLARRAEFAATGGAEGIVSRGDLAVTQLAVPGVGILIGAGTGLVLNRYQTTPNETYVVSNPDAHTVLPADMPASNPAAKSYIVAVVVGDPDFSQASHPWMGAGDPPAGTETTFAYVRPTLVEVANNTVTTLPAGFPGLVLARIDVPANTTTITNSMITDLRKLARPRQEQQIFVSGSGTWDNTTKSIDIPSGSAYADWGQGQFSPTVKVPSWAKRAIIVASINGVVLLDTSANVSGSVRVRLGTVNGPATVFDFPVGAGAVRTNLQTGGEFDVTGVAGTYQFLALQGFENVPAAPGTNQKLKLRNGTQAIIDVRFFEE